MDDPLVLAAVLLAAYALGLVLRLWGALLAALALGVVALVVNAQESAAQLVGGLVLGAGGGFALGWAGSLTRRLLRRT